MLSVQGLRRNVKNVVKNYTDSQVKVREATSNDPWGPSSTLMSEIADLTYNVVAFSEIMHMVWKRLNDHGKNWRHVYKALVLLEYLIKTGSEKVAQQCKENIFAIQTLKDFQYIEENKDQGMNVREKSKLLVNLLKDDERLKNERARALKAKERFAQATSQAAKEATGSTLPGQESSDSLGSPDGATSPRGFVSTELENARPQTAGEEELQLQLALAMSKEEAEQEDRVRRNDDLRLQMALNESQENYKRSNSETDETPQAAAMDDLLALMSPMSASGDATAIQSTDPWGMPVELPSEDPWATPSPPTVLVGNDPWDTSVPKPPSGMTHSASAPNDPWSASGGGTNNGWPSRMSTSASMSFETLGGRTNGELDDKDFRSRRSAMSSPDTSVQRQTPNPFDMTGFKDPLENIGYASNDFAQVPPYVRKTPETFLGANSNLVNLDALVSTQEAVSRGRVAESAIAASIGAQDHFGEMGAGNPFGMPPLPPASNPFQATRPPPPTINQLRSQTQFLPYAPMPPLPQMVAPQVLPLNMQVMGGQFAAGQQAATNPFL